MKTKLKTTKLAPGLYQYGDYRIRRTEDGNSWDILEDTPGGWFPVDRFETKRRCVEILARTEED